MKILSDDRYGGFYAVVCVIGLIFSVPYKRRAIVGLPCPTKSLQCQMLLSLDFILLMDLGSKGISSSNIKDSLIQ